MSCCGLTDLTIKRAERGEDLKIASTALQTEVDGGITDKSPGSALASPWRTLLERSLPERESGLQEYFSQHGFDHYLWPTKDKSHGGSGNPSMYYFENRAIPIKQDFETIESKTEVGLIRYIPELTLSPAWWLKKLLGGGYALHGWRRWMLIGFGALNIVIVMCVLFLTCLVLVYSNNLSFQVALSIVLFAAMIIFFSYSFLSPFYRLFEWRMIKAPEILISFGEDNVLIELVSANQTSGALAKVIRLVRYAGTCPICAGKVEVVEGKKEFLNRFVGRCMESPAEHVFSFDRVTLNGKLLR